MGANKSSQVAKTSDERQLYDDFLKNLVTDNQIVMFSKTSCSYCTLAKKLLTDLKLDFKSIELDVKNNCPNENCGQLSKTLVAQTRIKTVPQIFINGKCIGGFSDLEALTQDEKQFKKLLEDK